MSGGALPFAFFYLHTPWSAVISVAILFIWPILAIHIAIEGLGLLFRARRAPRNLWVLAAVPLALILQLAACVESAQPPSDAKLLAKFPSMRPDLEARLESRPFAYFSQWAYGLGGGIKTKGFMYSKDVPEPLVDDLNPHRLRSRRRSAYRHIEDHWYLYWSP